jgi:hypothetical protein
MENEENWWGDGWGWRRLREGGDGAVIYWTLSRWMREDVHYLNWVRNECIQI